LGFLGSVYSREPYYKDEGKEFILGKDPIDQLFIYNGKDAIVTFEILETMLLDLKEYKLESFFFSYVMKLHEFYMELESNGFLFSETIWKELLEKYQERKRNQQKRLEELAGYNVNANSPKQVFQFLTKDLSLPLKAGTGEDNLVALLGNHAKDDRSREAINLILDIRRVRKTIGTYLSAQPDFDGRMRTSYRIVGTETGRTSTSNLDPPLRPLKGFGLAFQTITKHGDIGADIRRMLVADEGYSILDPDLSQAEARVVSLLSDDEETLQLFDTTDIHKLTASWLFGKSMDSITKEERFIGKTVRHAGNYGMGKRRLMMDTNANAKRFGINIKLSEKDAGRILDTFHKRSSKIRSIFHTSIEGLLKNNRMTIINPFGRRRMFFERWGDKLFKEAYAFIPQSTVRDHLMTSTLRVQKRIPDLKFIVEAHDAMTCLVKDENINSTARIFKEEFEKPIDFSLCSIKRGMLTIPTEVKVGKNYKDLKDYVIQ
jgi:DNA polymerase-1